MTVGRPHWKLPAGVTALFCDRRGGHSAAPYASLNLGDHVGDCAAAVAANRALLQQHLPPGVHIQWLQQVHGTCVARLDGANGDHSQDQAHASTQPHCLRQSQALPVRARPLRADAAFTRTPGIACAVLSADCLPLLLCSSRGDAVAAVHAGWRGLAAGVVEQAVGAFDVDGEELLAWLGPTIGPAAFEVGPEVRAAFAEAACAAQRTATLNCFRPCAARPGHYLADLQQLAVLRLQSLGVQQIARDSRCTFNLPQQLFSYRRDGTTGRMAALILINPA